jgi:hypothetical protein
VKRELKRRSAVEPVIGHLKDDHRMDRNFLIPPTLSVDLCDPWIVTE